jgi:hypothetical protein
VSEFINLEEMEYHVPFEPKPQVTIPRAKEVREAAKPGVELTIVPRPSLPAVTSNEEYRQRYLDDVAPQTHVGAMIKFDPKEGLYLRQDTEEAIDGSRQFFALCHDVLVGRMRFNGPGMAPDRAMGLFYSDWVEPARETLGDLDQTKWQIGLDGLPSDPWTQQMYLPLADLETKELFTLVTSSKSGRRAVGNLLRSYDRLRQAKPGHVPIVCLRKGGFQHSDSRIGWVTVPTLVVMGSAEQDGSIMPDARAEADPFDQELPPNMK